MLPHFPGVKNLDLVIDFDPKFDVAPPLLLYGPLDVDSSIVEHRQYNLDVRPWAVEELTVELEPYGVDLAGIERCLSKREKKYPNTRRVHIPRVQYQVLVSSSDLDLLFRIREEFYGAGSCVDCFAFWESSELFCVCREEPHPSEDENS